MGGVSNHAKAGPQRRLPRFVTAGPRPGNPDRRKTKTWIRGSSPRMTKESENRRFRRNNPMNRASETRRDESGETTPWTRGSVVREHMFAVCS